MRGLTASLHTDCLSPANMVSVNKVLAWCGTVIGMHKGGMMYDDLSSYVVLTGGEASDCLHQLRVEGYVYRLSFGGCLANGSWRGSLRSAWRDGGYEGRRRREFVAN